MAKVERRVYINDDDFKGIVQKLKSEPLFKTINLTDFFAIAILFGKEKGFRTPLSGKKTGRIKEDTLNNSNLPYLMMAIAVEETDSFDVLAKEEDYFTISEEYAKTGFYAMEKAYFENPKGFLRDLELASLKYFDTHIAE